MRRLLLALTTIVTLIFCAEAGAATIPLGSQTFNQACTAAAAGDTVTVPAGNYSAQTLTCTKAVTITGAGPGQTVVSSLSFSGANGPTVTGMTFTGGVNVMTGHYVTVRNATINNLAYVEGSNDVLFDHVTWEPKAGGTSWENGDMLDVYEQANRPTNTRITVQDSVFHGLRSPTSTAHPDAIQFCNCDGTAGDSKHAIAMKILRTRFYDNECMNLRANPHTDLLLENNVFGDSVNGISGCGYYSLDVGYADTVARYNTFPGTQQIQQTPTVSGLAQQWIGNAGVGFSAGCTSGGAAGSVKSHNVWSGQTCGGTDKKVSSLGLNSDGSIQSGSPVIDYGDASVYPAKDIVGGVRPQGAFADAGAYEQAGLVDSTPPDTTITSAPSSGTDTSATLTFTATESGSTFECKLDSGAYAGCSSPKSYQGLALGSHTVSVRATDPAGNVDASPASASWTVSAPADTTAPDTTITDSPADGTAQAVSFAFTSNETGSTFDCKLDAGAYSSCTSPKSYTGLAVGSHTFSVRATDAAGNTDQSPAVMTWSVTATCTDELAAMTADRDAQKARADAAEADLAAMTSSRDAWKARAEKAEDQVARIKAIANEQ